MTSPQILIHRTDTALDDELREASTKLAQFRPVFHFSGELRKTITAARDFQPTLIMLEVGGDFVELKALIDETTAIAPEATIVGVYGTDQLPPELSESALMMRALRLGVEDFVRRPIVGTDLAQVMGRWLAPKRKQKTDVGHLVSFISNKGGVGKSTSAVNVAVELATRHSQRVALIDGSLQMGVCATQLDLRPESTLVDAWRQRERLDERLLSELMTLHDSGLHVLAAPSNAIEATEIDDAFLSRVLLLARRSYDFVVIDTFPLFDRTVMAILDLSDQAVVVVENVVPTLQTVRGFFDLLSEVEFPQERQKVLLNRYSTRAGGPSTQEVASYLGRSADYVIPYDRKVVLAANVGKPFVQTSGAWSKSGRAIKSLVDDIEVAARTDSVLSPRFEAFEEPGAGASSVSRTDEQASSANPVSQLGSELL